MKLRLYDKQSKTESFKEISHEEYTLLNHYEIVVLDENDYSDPKFSHMRGRSQIVKNKDTFSKHFIQKMLDITNYEKRRELEKIELDKKIKDFAELAKKLKYRFSDLCSYHNSIFGGLRMSDRLFECGNLFLSESGDHLDFNFFRKNFDKIREVLG